MRVAISSLSDDIIIEQHATLSSRLDAMEAQLQALSTVVETRELVLHGSTDDVLSCIAGFGCIVSPLPITAADLHMGTAPGYRGARLGHTLQLHMSLGARHAAWSTEELQVSLSSLVGSTRIEATLDFSGVEPQSRTLKAMLEPNVGDRCLVVSLAIPFAFCNDSDVSINIGTVSVAGQPVLGLPLRFPVQCRGITAPMKLSSNTNYHQVTPCISPEGLVFCPPGVGSDVLVYDADGAALPSMSFTSFGIASDVNSAAYAHGDIPILLLGGNRHASRLVAVNPLTREARWVSATDEFSHCFAMAALPAHEVVVASSGSGLCAYSLADGRRVGALPDTRIVLPLTADIATGAVYGSMLSVALSSVHAWSCTPDGAGVLIASAGPVPAAGAIGAYRPLAVMPPAPGKKASHLVVGCNSTGTLVILSLPSRALVHTHDLEGMSIVGMAADPWGKALAVLDAGTRSLNVLAWPLPGMPQLV